MLEKNLTTVIDLRTSNEIEKEPNPFSDIGGVTFINIPLLENLAPDFLGTSKIGKISNDPLLSFYLSALHERQSAIRNIFSAISDSSPGLILFNCTAGKDRAGFAAAITLIALGVSKEDVIEDYMKTNSFTKERIEKMLDQIELMSLYQTDVEILRPLLGVERIYIETAFKTAEETYN